MVRSKRRSLLLEIIKSKGTQQFVADELNISRQYLGMMASGQRNPTVKLMAKMESYFSIDAEKLFPDLFFEANCHKMKQRKKNSA